MMIGLHLSLNHPSHKLTPVLVGWLLECCSHSECVEQNRAPSYRQLRLPHLREALQRTLFQQGLDCTLEDGGPACRVQWVQQLRLENHEPLQQLPPLQQHND